MEELLRESNQLLRQVAARQKELLRIVRASPTGTALWEVETTTRKPLASNALLKRFLAHALIGFSGAVRFQSTVLYDAYLRFQEHTDEQDSTVRQCSAFIKLLLRELRDVERKQLTHGRYIVFKDPKRTLEALGCEPTERPQSLSAMGITLEAE